MLRLELWLFAFFFLSPKYYYNVFPLQAVHFIIFPFSFLFAFLLAFSVLEQTFVMFLGVKERKKRSQHRLGFRHIGSAEVSRVLCLASVLAGRTRGTCQLSYQDRVVKNGGL